MKTWTIMNQDDGNDTFEVQAETFEIAASQALQELGWTICVPPEEIEQEITEDCIMGNS